MMRRSKFEILGVKSKVAKMPRSRFQDVQSVPAGRYHFPLLPRLPGPYISSPKMLTSTSISRDLDTTFANMFQVHRQRVTHLQSDEGSVPRMRRSSGGSVKLSSQLQMLRRPRSHVGPNQDRKLVCSYSILSSSDSSSPSSKTSGGSTSTPRSPTSFPPTSTTSTGARSSRTGQCMSSDRIFVIMFCYRLSIRF